MRTSILALLSLVFIAGASAAPVPKGLKPKQSDAEVFVGAWELVVSEDSGKPHPVPHTWTFDPDLTMWSKKVGADGKGHEWKVKIDPEQSPKHIDIGEHKGVYEIDGDEIRIVYAYTKQRPTGFDQKATMSYNVLRRVKGGGK